MNREYRVDKFENHPAMQAALNLAARDGWEPIHYAVQSTDSHKSWHYVILARTVRGAE
jgi:hypothetical protein